MGLILGIIGILVIAAGIGATAYYGGDSYVDSTIKGEANTFITEASQVRTGATLYKAHELVLPDTLAEMITERHLGSEPSNTYVIDGPADGNTGQITALASTNANLTDQVCAKVEEEATDTDVDPASLPTTETAGQLYGCFNDATNGITMYYN